MKHIATLAVLGGLALALPSLAHAAEQCTTSELDLMCPSGQVLQSIRPNGSKVCLNVSSLISDRLAGIKCRSCIRVSDHGCSNPSSERCTNWISLGIGGSSRSGMAHDGDKYDPDCMEVRFECR